MKGEAMLNAIRGIVWVTLLSSFAGLSWAQGPRESLKRGLSKDAPIQARNPVLFSNGSVPPPVFRTAFHFHLLTLTTPLTDAAEISSNRCAQSLFHNRTFEPGDFRPIRSFQALAGNDLLFSAWAAQVANYASLWNGKRVSELFAYVARSRGQLQKILDLENEDPNTPMFGVVRRHQKSVDIYLDKKTRWASYAPVRKGRTKFVSADPNGFADIILESFPGLQEPNTRETFKTHYTLRNGEALVLSAFRVEEHQGKPCLVIYHPGEHDQIRIMRDVFSRLQTLYEKKKSDQDLDLIDMNVFFSAMRGYFGAVNYFRGSAAIGRATLTGLFYAFFENKLSVGPDTTNLDVVSMANDELHFVSKMLTYNGLPQNR
jgi:hypothetical protein